MFYGLDVHRRFIQVCCVDSAGTVERTFRIDATHEAILAFAETLGPDDQLVLEATFHTWATHVEMDVKKRSIALAMRVQKDAKALPGQIGRAFRLVLGRKPTDEERRSMHEYVTAMIEHHNSHQPQPTTYPTKVVRSLVEEFSGETFEFDELLPVFEDYVPDAKPATVSAETRALADMCLLLLNANEFVYVY